MNTTTTNTFLPGQLLRVTRNFAGINQETGRLHSFVPGDVFFLVSIEEGNPYYDYNTTLVTNTGELVVVEWYESGFTKCWTPAAP